MDKKGFQLVSAILRGKWLINGDWAESHISLATQLFSREFLDRKAFDDDPYEDIVDPDDIGFSGRLIGGSVCEIYISGPMLKYGGMCSSGTLDYINSIQLAEQDDRVKAILLKIDSPGGEVRSIPLLSSIVQNCSKPIVAYIEDLAASAAYYTIAGADYIIASLNTTEIGSIGVYQTIADYSEYFEKAGVKVKSHYSRLSEEKNQPYREALKGNDSLLLDDLDYIATEFHEAVRNGRGDKINLSVSDPFKGKVYFAPEALKVGLIDTIGDYQSALEKALELATDSNFLTQKNNNNMFGDKYAALTALRGIAATDITEEQLEAANAALDARGVAGVRVINAGWIQEAEDLQETADASAAEVTRLTAELATATADRDKFKTLAETFGAKPARGPAAPQKADSKPEITDDKDDSHLSEADVQLAKLKAQAGLIK